MNIYEKIKFIFRRYYECNEKIINIYEKVICNVIFN